MAKAQYQDWLIKPPAQKTRVAVVRAGGCKGAGRGFAGGARVALGLLGGERLLLAGSLIGP